MAIRLAEDGADVALTYQVGRCALFRTQRGGNPRPLGRGERQAAPAEIAAGTVSHLAGPDGRYITGASIHVDGGFTV